MSWEAVSALADSLGAIGVVVSLVYVAIEIRRNTRTMRGATHEVSIEHANSVILSMGTSPVLAGIVLRGCQDFTSLSKEERLQFGCYWQAAFIGTEGSHLQYTRGNLDENVWQRDISVLRPWLQTPGVQIWWERNPVVFTPEFSAIVQSEMDMSRTRSTDE